MKFKKSPIKIFCLVLGMIFFVTIIYGKTSLLSQIVVYNHSASLPVGWYVVVPDKNYKVGDIVVFDLQEKARALAVNRGWIRENDLFMKRIGALEGVEYEITRGRQFLINRNVFGDVQNVDSLGRNMPEYIGKYIVPPNEFLPVADIANSYDGRYYGTVPIENIRFKVIPLYIID